MVFQFEDVVDRLRIMHPHYHFVFLFDHGRMASLAPMHMSWNLAKLSNQCFLRQMLGLSGWEQTIVF
jgi:hypothetical protein